MVNKYVRVLEAREINPNTGEIWTINDVPTLWRTKVEKKILDDGYYIQEDGTVDNKVYIEK